MHCATLPDQRCISQQARKSLKVDKVFALASQHSVAAVEPRYSVCNLVRLRSGLTSLTAVRARLRYVSCVNLQCAKEKLSCGQLERSLNQPDDRMHPLL